MDNNETSPTKFCATLHESSLSSAEVIGGENARFRRPEQLALKFGDAVLRQQHP